MWILGTAAVTATAQGAAISSSAIACQPACGLPSSPLPLRRAEALGAIGTGECVEYLTSYTGPDEPVMLRESCEVALDVVDYWAAGGAAEKEGDSEAAAAPVMPVA
jgi:hypothetical protein